MRADEPALCYVYHGEETYLAEDFLRGLRKKLIAPEAPEFSETRFDLGESSWVDVLDAARTSPFFFSSRQIVVAEMSGENREGFSPLEKKILKEYLRSPNPRTVLFVIITGRVKKTHPLVKFFDGLRSDSIVIVEMKPMKEDQLPGWIGRKIRSFGKSIVPEAAARMAEMIGSDLWRLENELLKVVAYAGDRKIVDLEDINLVCDWKRSYLDYELSDGLEKGARDKVLLILNQLFEGGEKPERIVGTMSRFFSDLMLAKLWLREKRDRKEIFARLRPQLKESFGSLYFSKFNSFFNLVGEMSDEELNFWLRELAAIDLAIKTSDISAQVRLESFVFEYCKRRGRWRRKTSSLGGGRAD